MTTNPQTGTIARSAGTVSFAVLMSRVLGLVREQVFAVLFGAGYAYDAFIVAFRIPNLLRDLFAEGTLSSAFVPVFTDYHTNKDPEATWQLAGNVITAVIVTVGIIVLLGIVFSGRIVSLMAPDFSLIAGKHELTSIMTSIMFPFLLLVSLAAIAMGILNSLGKFFIPAITSSFFNLGSIVSGVLLASIASRFDKPPILGMAVGVLIGGALQLAIQVPSLFKQGFRFTLRLNFFDEGLQRIMHLMLPAVIGLSATQINIFINTFFASSCAQGSVSWLNYAFRLLMFPIGVIGVSLSVSTMPLVAKFASRGETSQLRDAFVSSTTLSLIFTIPASFGLIFMARPIVCLIFEHGQFSALDTINTARALSLYAIGIFAYAAVKIIVPFFYALNKTRYPVIGSFITVFLNILFVSLTLDSLQFRAIALSTSLCVIVNFLFLSFILYHEIEGYPVAYLSVCLIKIVSVSVVMGAGAYWLEETLRALAGTGLLAQALALFITICCAVIFYLAVISIMGISEVNYLGAKLRARLLKKPS